MKTFILIAAVILALYAAKFVNTAILGTDEIEYRGEKIKLTRKYADYDAYKNDAGNIAIAELPRIERLVRDAKVGPVFKDWASFVDEEFKIKVPGYGCGVGPVVVATDRDLLVSSVEIPTRPRAAKLRYFVLERLPDKSLHLIDDFVESSYPRMAELHLIDGRLVYFSKDKAVIRETKL